MRHAATGRSWLTVTTRVATLGLLAGLGAVACERGDATPVTRQPETARPLHRPATFDPSVPGLVACSSSVLEGNVVRVVDGRPGRMLATVAVDHWVKPVSGPSRATFDLVDIAREGVYERWPPGTQLRLVVDVDPASLPEWQFTAEQFSAFEQAVPAADRLTCPYGPHQRTGS